MVVAEKYLHMPVEHRPVKFSEVPDFAECGLCGTAAVISPIGKVVDHGKEICFPCGMEGKILSDFGVTNVPSLVMKMKFAPPVSST